MLGQRIEFTLTPVQVTLPPQQTWSKAEEGFIDIDTHWANNQTATLLLVRGLLQSQGLLETASTVILRAWRCCTTRQYSSYLRRWEQYCRTRKVHPISATVIDGVNYIRRNCLTVQLILFVQLYLLSFILLRDVRLVITPWWSAFWKEYLLQGLHFPATRRSGKFLWF